tara:strand:+ start:454 stop:1146 length:693 start_codon:yes stop_codon:yes gene_type:complete
MKIKIEVPDNINSIKLGDYQKYTKIIEGNENASDEFIETKLLEIFCDVKYKDIHDLPVGTFEEVTTYLYEIFDVTCPLIRRFNMTGSDGVEVEFGFIPNLDKMTMGEYIDLNNYFEGVDTLHKAMAVLFRPIHKSYKDREKYLISSYEGTEFFSEVMKDMPLGIALGARVFFYRLGMKLSRAILNSSRQLLEEDSILSEEEKSVLTKNIAGIKSFTHLQGEMLSKSKNLL